MLEAAQEFIDFKEAQLEDQQKVEEKKQKIYQPQIMPTFSKNLFGLYEEAITGLVKTYPNNKGMKKSSSCIAAILKKPNGANQSCCTFQC